MLMPKYKIAKLKSGLRVLLVPDKHVDSVDVTVMFRVGSRCEMERIAGISHFLEHMFFKGTVKRSQAKDISEAVDSVGGEINAFTSHEYTGYYIKVAKNHVDLAVDVLSDMILNSKFDQKELDRERNVVKEEMKMYEDTPLRYIWTVWNEVMYGNQGIGREIAGTRESLDNINRQEMVDYRNDYYSVSNGLLVIVGNFNEEHMMSLLNKHWKDIKTGEKSVFTPTDDTQKKPACKLLYKDIQQANICLGVRGFETFHPDHFIGQVMSVILGQGMSSRLFLSVRERRGLAYSVHSAMDLYTDAGNFVVNLGTDAQKAEQAISLILSEFKKMRKEKVDHKELRKAKEYWKGKMILSMEDVDAMASMIGMQELLFDKIVSPKEMIERIESVTAKQVQRLANELFTNERLNLALIGPYKKEDKFKKLLKL